MILPKIILGVVLALIVSVLFFSFSSYTKPAMASLRVLTDRQESSSRSGLTFTSRKLARTKIMFLTPTPQPKPQVTTKTTETTPTPTEKPTMTPTATPTVTKTATPTPVKSGPTPTPQPQNSGSNDAVQNHIMNAINDYRRANGLATVKTDPYTCSFAKTRAKEITSGFNHDGFRSRIANKSLPYPSYSMVTENIAQTSDYTKVVPMWIASAGHAENMRKDTPFVCVEREGDYYAYLAWKP